MLRFLMQRLLALVPVLFTVAVIVFLILRLTPGDPAAVIAGNNATNEDIDRIREQLGLTKPLITQFMIWLGQVVQGDLGYSFYLNRPVTELIAQRLARCRNLEMPICDAGWSRTEAGANQCRTTAIDQHLCWCQTLTFLTQLHLQATLICEDFSEPHAPARQR